MTQATNNLSWEMHRIESRTPPVLCLWDGAVRKYIEEPFNPEAEAVEALASRFPEMAVLVTVPCSTGTFESLIQQAPGLKKILVVDQDKARLEAWAETLQEFDFDNVEILHLPEDKADAVRLLRERIGEFTVELFLGQSAVYVPARFKRLAPETAELLEKEVLELQRDACTAAAFKTTRSWHMTLNQLLNLKRPAAKLFPKYPADKRPAAVIVGAGPSLDHNIHVLKRYSDRALIIATDASLNSLFEDDIVPDYAASLEDVHLGWRFFTKNIARMGNVPLVAPLQAGHVLTRNYPGPIIFVANNDTPQWIRPFCAGLPHMDFGQCVGHFVFHVAEHLRPSEIIMVGFDLSFKEGHFHPKAMPVPYFKDQPESFRFVEVDGIDGGKVKTDLSMRMYLKYFEEKIARISCPVIDATEGGALIRGTQIKSLEEAICGKEPFCRMQPSQNDAFAFPEKKLCLRNLESELKKISLDLQGALGELADMKPGNARNPLSSFPLKSDAFNLLSSCCSILLMSKFSSEAASYEAARFSRFHDSLKALLCEMNEVSDFLNMCFGLMESGKQKPRNGVLRIAGSDAEASILAIFGERFPALAASSALPDIWAAATRHGVAALAFCNGSVTPDAWTAPCLSCIDVKTEYPARPYERSFWLPGYQVACRDSALLNSWREFVPPDIPCGLLEEVASICQN